MRASASLQADCHAWGLSYCAPELLAWDYRWPRIAATLKSADADIVCLQEVEPARCGFLGGVGDVDGLLCGS